MSWIEALDDPKKIEAIYGGQIPSLDRLVLHEIRVHRDGPRVTFVVDLVDFPADPPSKWVAQEFNTVQLALIMDGVTGVRIEGLGSDSIIDLDLARIGDEVQAMTSVDSSSRIDVRGRWASVTLSAYLDGGRTVAT